jgi:hypothetical protein
LHKLPTQLNKEQLRGKKERKKEKNSIQLTWLKKKNKIKEIIEQEQ